MSDHDSLMTLLDIQARVSQWARRNFPTAQPWEPLIGLQEELGELAHAFLKLHQGIRGTVTQHRAAMRDAVGDIVVYLAHFAELNGIDLQTAVAETWAEVQKRDWVANPIDGRGSAVVPNGPTESTEKRP